MINIRGIFVGSFVAMLATGAVAANNTPSIASKAYVKSQIQPVAAVADTAIQPGDNVSALTNDAGYLTQHQDISGKADKTDVYTRDQINNMLDGLSGDVESIGTQINDALSEYTKTTNLATVALTGDYDDLSNVPTNVSEFTNDAGYLTQHQSLAAYDTAEQIAETYETKSNAASVYETKEHAAETYLTEHQSLADYDTAQEIAETYLTKNDAANTYLSQSDAATTYETIESAAKYETKTDASETFVSKGDAAATYLSKTDASNTYLTKADAAGTYLSQHQDISGKADVATVTALSNTVDGISNKIGTGTMTVNGGTQETVIAAINALDSKTNGIATETGLATLQENVTALAGRVGNNENAIEILNGDEDVPGSVDAKIATATSDMETQTNAAATYLSKTDAATTYATISDMNGKQPTISDLTAIRDGAALGATALQKNDVTTGGENGTIAVDGTDVAVRGLGTAAFTNATAYVTVPAASGTGGKQVLTYDGDTGTYYWESIGR